MRKEGGNGEIFDIRGTSKWYFVAIVLVSADNFVSTSNWIGDSYNENIMNGRCMKRDR